MEAVDKYLQGSLLLRNAVTKKDLIFAQKRILRDFEALLTEKVPLVGASARPLETNMFIWHANLRVPKFKAYPDTILHFEIVFPQSYPNHPPTIRPITSFTHPYLVNGYVCLDMLTTYSSGLKLPGGGGWSSCYSIVGILMQLQSWIASYNITVNEHYVKNYRCTACKHKGQLQPWPTLSEKPPPESDFKITEELRVVNQKNLFCYHTRQSFRDNQLGLGLNITKIPRTGKINEAEVFQDYLSVKAFIKESVRETTLGDPITHWLPVFFGKGDNQDRFDFFLKKGISMIMTNSTKYFQPEFVLEVFPKLFLTLVVQIMDQKQYPSIRVIRLFTHVHSMFLYCLDKYPELREKIDQQLTRFIEDPKYRTKEEIPNLGASLALAAITDSFKFEQLVNSYFEEQLDRHVFWILKNFPELISQQLTENADKVRVEGAFNCQITSFHISCFYKLFITSICQKRKNKDQLLQEYLDNQCKLSDKEENKLQNQIFEIFTKVKSFSEYFKFMNMKERSEDETIEMLKQAIKNSEAKGYHNKQEILEWQLKMDLKKAPKNKEEKIIYPKELPSLAEQVQHYLNNSPNYDHLITCQKVEGKEDYSYEEVLSSENDWKELCTKKWAWIRQALVGNYTLTSREVSQMAFKVHHQGDHKTEDRLTSIRQNTFLNPQNNKHQPQLTVPNVSWKQLFLRLDLEEFLKYMDMNPDYQTYYKKVYICARNQLNTLMFPIIKISNLKSGYYYLTSLLAKIPSLKYLQFSGMPHLCNKITMKLAKAIKKGLNNFHEAKGALQIYSIHNLMVDQDVSDCLFSYLNHAESLISLRISHSNVLAYDTSLKMLNKTNIKEVREVELVHCYLNAGHCKILADGLMKMKKLTIFRMNNQIKLGKGLGAIVYNLSFHTNLEILDLQNINLDQPTQNNSASITELITSLQKFIKINSNVSILNLIKIEGLNQRFTQQFWSSLGVNISLQVLNLSFSGSLQQQAYDIGRAVAFNAKKKGKLSELHLLQTLQSSYGLQQLHKGMSLSDYHEEKWYGDATKAAQMIAQNYEKKYYNNLRVLKLNNCANLNPSFNLTAWNELVDKKQPPEVKLFADSQQLQSVHLRGSNINRSGGQIMYLALDQRRKDLQSRIKILDLSKNLLGKQGVKTLSSMLPFNNIIEVLDVSKTGMTVSGADSLFISLKDNTSLKYLNVFNNMISFDGAKSIAENIICRHPNLQFLEIGHNRIRDKGFHAIVDAILINEKSRLKFLACRFNFISSHAVMKGVRNLNTGKHTLEELFIRSNQQHYFMVKQLETVMKECLKPFTIDLLEHSKFLDTDKTDRTIWIHPFNQQINLQRLKFFFETRYKCGIITDFRVRIGTQYPNRKGNNSFCFVEFADETSVRAALSLAARKMTVIGKQKFRIFKAGTGTFLFRKKPTKETKREQAFAALMKPLGHRMPVTKKPKNRKEKKKEQQSEQRLLNQIKQPSALKRLWIRMRSSKIQVLLLLLAIPCIYLTNKHSEEIMKRLNWS